MSNRNSREEREKSDEENGAIEARCSASRSLYASAGASSKTTYRCACVRGDISPVIKKRLVKTSRGPLFPPRTRERGKEKERDVPIFLYYNIVPLIC